MCVTGCRYGAKGGLTAQQSRELIETAERKATASVGLAALDGGGGSAARALRAVPLGHDRSRATFWDLACSPALAGRLRGRPVIRLICTIALLGLVDYHVTAAVAPDWRRRCSFVMQIYLVCPGSMRLDRIAIRSHSLPAMAHPFQADIAPRLHVFQGAVSHRAAKAWRSCSGAATGGRRLLVERQDGDGQQWGMHVDPAAVARCATDPQGFSQGTSSPHQLAFHAGLCVLP